MRKSLLFIPFLALTAACEDMNLNRDTGALGGAAAGAALGAAVADDDEIQGAILGGAAGALAGHMLGKAQEPGMCYYRDRYGNRYTAACP